MRLACVPAYTWCILKLKLEKELTGVIVISRMTACTYISGTIAGPVLKEAAGGMSP